MGILLCVQRNVNGQPVVMAMHKVIKHMIFDVRDDLLMGNVRR